MNKSKTKSESLCLVPIGLIYFIKGDVKVKSKVLSYDNNCEGRDKGLVSKWFFTAGLGMCPKPSFQTDEFN